MRLHPLSAVTRGLQRGVVLASAGFFLASTASVVAPEGIDTAGLVAVLATLGFLLGAAYQVAYYLRFEYDLTADTLDVASGVVGRREREVPYRRIQNVDITESILHRLVGVAVVRVETAGGSTTEVTLNFVTSEEARRLQREIRERRAAAVGEGRTEPTEQPATEEPGATTAEADRPTATASGAPRQLFELGAGELLVLSLSSFRRAVVFVLFVAVPFLADPLLALLEGVLGAPLDVGAIRRQPDLFFLSALGGLVLGAVGSWMLSAAATFGEYYGFTLGRQGEDLVYDRGLVQRYSGSIPTDKVQTLTVRENVVMRALGYAGLAVETAGYSPGQREGQSGPQSAVPLATRERTLSLARDIEPFGDISVQRPPKVARRRYAARYLLAVLALTGALWAVAQVVAGFTLWFTPLVLLPLVPVAAHCKWTHRGFRAGEDHFVARTGFWRRTTRVVPYYRLQTVVRSRSVFQRRLGLAHLTADTATSSSLGHRDATAFDVEAGTARDLFARCRDRLQASLGAPAAGPD
ncbi:MAG: PH domain-containing protein [Halorientalis sp.]